MPPDPPIPIAATFNTVAQHLTVEFDQVLAPDPALDATNWGICDGINNRTFVALAALGPVVSGPAFPPPAGPCGAPQVTYSPPPFDVLGATGSPTVAFTMPLVIV